MILPRTFCLLACSALLLPHPAAARRDTVLSGNGSAGPYYLGSGYVDSASVRAQWRDTSAGELPAFVYLPARNALLFSLPLDSGAAFRVAYTLQYRSVPRMIRAFEPRSWEGAREDSTLPPPDLPRHTGGYRDNVTVSGYKSVGVSLGSLGQLNVEQALEVTLGGEIAPRTELSAHISDQGSSFEGTTREVGELDMVHVSLTHPLFSVTVGDQYTTWPIEGPFAGSRKLKGIAASYTPGRLALGAFGALSGGRRAVQTIAGRDAHQGPYYLRGNGETGPIAPVAGTVEVTVDGKNLSEGPRNDYTIDYASGTLTFTPRFLMTAERIIHVTYEYRTHDYLRTSAGGHFHGALAESLVTVSGAIWTERDNRAHPLDFTLSETDRELLRLAGDREGRALYVRRIEGVDVPIESATAPLYRLADTVIAANPVPYYTYAPFNPAVPIPSTPRYLVHFVEVDSTSGDYVLDRIEHSPGGLPLPVHRFVGAGRGTWTVPDAKPSPQATTIAQARIGFNPAPRLTFETTVLARDHDRNLFSQRDNHDNRGGAARTHIGLARRQQGRSLYGGVTHRFASTHISVPMLDPWEREERWQGAAHDSANLQIVDAVAGVSGGAALDASVRGGVLHYRGSPAMVRAGGELALRPPGPLRATLASDLMHHGKGAPQTLSRRDYLTLQGESDRAAAAIGVFDEVAQYRDGSTRGHIGSSARFTFEPLGLEEHLIYTQQQTGSAAPFFFFRSRPDSGQTLLWEQRLAFNPRRDWRMGGSSSWHRRTSAESGTRHTLLATLHHELGPRPRGVGTSQRYELSIEQASAVVQVPTWAGRNLGTHLYDSLSDQYVVSRTGRGDYLMLERELFDTLDARRVRKHRLEGNWSYHPSGEGGVALFNDLVWRGGVRIEEHIIEETLSREHTPRSWVPGALSLSPLASWSPYLSLSECSYRQEIGWRPRARRSIRADLELRPSVRQNRTLREAGTRGVLGVEGERGEWFLRGEVEGERFVQARERGGEPMQAYDLSAALTQRYSLPRSLALSLVERAGRAQMGQGAFTRTDSSWYVSLIPGVSWRPAGGGGPN